MKKSLVIGIIIVIAIILVVFYAMRDKKDNGSSTTDYTNSSSTSADGTATTSDNGNGSGSTGSGSMGTKHQLAAPIVITNSTAAVTTSTAVVSGQITPNGSSTTYWIEYGKTNNLGSRTPTQQAGADFAVHPASAYITILAPGTHYYFRVTAHNALGTVSGKIYDFTTAIR